MVASNGLPVSDKNDNVASLFLNLPIPSLTPVIVNSLSWNILCLSKNLLQRLKAVS